MRLLCLTSNEFCTSADPADVRRQVEAQLQAAQRSRKAYPHAYRAEGYKVLHVGSGSFAKHDRRHHQSDHNYVWTVLDVRTPAATPPKHPVDVYVACFQEMFVRSSLHPSQTKTARTMDAVLRAHGLGHRYEVESTGIVGEANLTSFGKRRKRMGLGLYVWSRAPLAEQTALKALHAKGGKVPASKADLTEETAALMEKRTLLVRLQGIVEEESALRAGGATTRRSTARSVFRTPARPSSARSVATTASFATVGSRAAAPPPRPRGVPRLRL